MKPIRVPTRRDRMDALEDAVSALDSTEDRLIRAVHYTRHAELKVRLLQQLSRVSRTSRKLERRLVQMERDAWDEAMAAEIKEMAS